MTDVSVLTPSYHYARFIVDGIEIEPYWGGFGSWVIEASQGDADDRRGAAIRAKDYSATGPPSLQVSWDGRDGLLDAGLVLQHGPFRNASVGIAPAASAQAYYARIGG
jgi:hypothetical protein